MKTLLIDIARQLEDIANDYGSLCDREQPEMNSERARLRVRAQHLQTRVAAVAGLVEAARGETLTGWTDAHRRLFGEWIRKTYPNEASAGTIALGDAWIDGLRVGASVGLVSDDAAAMTDEQWDTERLDAAIQNFATIVIMAQRPEHGGMRKELKQTRERIPEIARRLSASKPAASMVLPPMPEHVLADLQSATKYMQMWAKGEALYAPKSGYDEPGIKSATISDVKKSAKYLAPRLHDASFALQDYFAAIDCALAASPAAPQNAQGDTLTHDDDENIQPTPESERAAFNAMMRWHLIRLLQAWRYGGDLRAAGIAAFEWARTHGVGRDAFAASERAVKLAAAPAAPVEHSECCDTAAYCSSVRRCTAKDAAAPAQSEPARCAGCVDRCTNNPPDCYAAPQPAQTTQAGEPTVAWMTLDCVHLKPCNVHLDKSEVEGMRPEHVVELIRRTQSAVVLDDERAAIDFAVGYMTGRPGCEKDVAVLETIGTGQPRTPDAIAASPAPPAADALARELLDALQKTVLHFTRTPSTLADSRIRGEAHAAIGRAYAQIGYDRPAGAADLPAPQPYELSFPVMLRKMWTGAEVQQWLDDLPALYAGAPLPDTWRKEAERYRLIRASAERCDSGFTVYWRLHTVNVPVGRPQATLDESLDAILDGRHAPTNKRDNETN